MVHWCSYLGNSSVVEIGAPIRKEGESALGNTTMGEIFLPTKRYDHKRKASSLSMAAPATGASRFDDLHEEAKNLKDADGNPINVFEVDSRVFLTKLALRLQVLVVIGITVPVSATLLPTLWASVIALVLAFPFGIFMTQVALCAHDIGHKSALKNKTAQFWLGLIIGDGILAVCHSWWTTKHNQHHATPNDPDTDPDVAIPIAVFEVEEAATRSRWAQPILRHQHNLFPIFFTIQALNTQLRVTPSYLRTETVKTIRREDKALAPFDLIAQWAAIIVHWSIIAVLWWITGWVVGLSFFLPFMMVHGFCNSTIFAPNHKPMPHMKATADTDRLFIQAATACNVSGGRFVTFWYGNLRKQIEHHLFPWLPSNKIHLISDLVMEYCRKYDIPYTVMTPWESWMAIRKILKDVALQLRARHEAAKRLKKAV